MSTLSLSSLKPGSSVITPENNSLWNYFKNREEKRIVLGASRAGLVPLSIQGSQATNHPSYVLTHKDMLQHHLDTFTRTRLVDAPLSKEAENVMKLWQAPFLWKSDTRDDFELKENSRFYVGFEDGLVTQLADKEPKDLSSYAELFVGDSDSTGPNVTVGNRKNMPLEFYGQIELLASLLSQLTMSTKEVTSRAKEIKTKLIESGIADRVVNLQKQFLDLVNVKYEDFNASECQFGIGISGPYTIEVQPNGLITSPASKLKDYTEKEEPSDIFISLKYPREKIHADIESRYVVTHPEKPRFPATIQRQYGSTSSTLIDNPLEDNQYKLLEQAYMTLLFLKVRVLNGEKSIRKLNTEKVF